MPITMPSGAIDSTYLRVAKILTFSDAQPLTNATGFFYLQDKFLYLITSRHVVIDEENQHLPDRIQVSLHRSAATLFDRSELIVPLYLKGIPQWYEHRDQLTGSIADIVAVAINDPGVLSKNVVSTFCRDDVVMPENVLPLGQDVLILGFPLGFHDTVNNLPIVRSATLASSFSHPFKGEPYFLTDARLHRGMSGSPVIAKLPVGIDTGQSKNMAWRLLGVHSSALDVSDRDPDHDERLGLNTSIYASLIHQLIPDQSSQRCEVDYPPAASGSSSASASPNKILNRK